MNNQGNPNNHRPIYPNGGNPQNFNQAPNHNPNYNPHHDPSYHPGYHQGYNHGYSHGYNHGYNHGYTQSLGQTSQIPAAKQNPHVCSVLAIIFGLLGFMPFLNFLFIPAALIFAIIGAALSTGRKKWAVATSFAVIAVSIAVSLLVIFPALKADDESDVPPVLTPATNGLDYKELTVGDVISTDFVTITVEELSTATTIKSIESSVVMNADSGEEYVYISGTIKNTSDATYDVGSMGSISDGNVDMMVDSELIMSDGSIKTGFLFVDDGGMYGIISNGTLEPDEEVKYYIAFLLDRSMSEYYMNGEIKIAFTDSFGVKPSYDHSNCQHLYKIDVK